MTKGRNWNHNGSLNKSDLMGPWSGCLILIQSFTQKPLEFNLYDSQLGATSIIHLFKQNKNAFEEDAYLPRYFPPVDRQTRVKT